MLRRLSATSSGPVGDTHWSGHPCWDSFGRCVCRLASDAVSDDDPYPLDRTQMSRMRRKKTIKAVTRRVRRYRTVTVTRQIMQCERPYVLFGEAVRDARKVIGLTQQELADKLGHSRGSIANIETGRQRVLLSDVFDFAKALKMQPRKLFEAVMT